MNFWAGAEEKNKGDILPEGGSSAGIVAHAGHVSSRDELLEVLDEDGQQHVFWDSSVVPEIEAFFAKLANVSARSLYEGKWSTLEGADDIISPGSLLDRAFGVNLAEG